MQDISYLLIGNYADMEVEKTQNHILNTIENEIIKEIFDQMGFITAEQMKDIWSTFQT